MKDRAGECDRIRKAMEAILEGNYSHADLKKVRLHLDTCPSCKQEFLLDLKIIEAIRDIPQYEFQSVAAEVVQRVDRMSRQMTAIRWIVGVGTMLILAVAAYLVFPGLRLSPLEMIESLETSTVLSSLGFKISALMRALVEVFTSLSRRILVPPGDLGAYRLYVLSVVAIGIGFMLALMFGFSEWLKKARRVYR